VNLLDESVVGEPGATGSVSSTVFDVDGPVRVVTHRVAVDESPAGAPPIATALGDDHPAPAGLDFSRDYFPQPRVEARQPATRPPEGAPSMVEAVAAIVMRADGLVA
jgi:hypothetical protein